LTLAASDIDLLINFEAFVYLDSEQFATKNKKLGTRRVISYDE